MKGVKLEFRTNPNDILEKRLPLGPRVRPTASASLSMPACMAAREFWSKAISLAEALTAKRCFGCL